MSKKYYIPTSILNFANILSTESISPKSFYRERTYGIKRWQGVPLNDADNYISLYSEPPKFECPPSELEDHPLIVELELSEDQACQHLKAINDQFFVCDHTLYFHPQNVRFIFFTEAHRKVAISLSEQLLETKTLHLYHRRLFVENKFSYNAKSQEVVKVELNRKELDKDSKINKLKGLLYGYYIGATLSCSKDSVVRLSTLWQIQDVISAIVSNENRIPTAWQTAELARLLDDYSPIKKEFDELHLDNNLERNILELIEKFYSVKSIYSVPSVSELVSSLQVGNKSKTEPEALRWITSQMAHLENSMSEGLLLSPEKSEIVVVDKLLSNVKVQDDQERILFSHWANGLLLDKYYDGGCSVYQKELADDITIAAKELIGSEWDKSPVRDKLNGIRYIVAGESFGFEYDNGVVSSISAVILKSDSWEQMLRFMQRKGMYDYRLAFALYGELKGFANLYSTFTDNLLLKERNYVWNVYQEFYGQLFDERIGQTKIIQSEVLDDLDEIKDRKDNDNIADNNPKVKNVIDGNLMHSDQDTFDGKDSQEMDRNPLGIKNDIGVLYSSVQNIFLDSNFSIIEKKWPGAKDFYTKLVLGLSMDCHTESELWKKLKNAKKYWDKSRDEWCYLVKKHDPSKKDKILLSGQGLLPLEFSKPTSPFWCDANAWGYIVDLVPKKSQKSIKNDLMWFQDEFRKGADSKNYAKASRDNKKTIDAFCRLKMDKEKYPEVQKYFPDKLRETIKLKLYSLYGVKE